MAASDKQSAQQISEKPQKKRKSSKKMPNPQAFQSPSFTISLASLNAITNPNDAASQTDKDNELAYCRVVLVGEASEQTDKPLVGSLLEPHDAQAPFQTLLERSQFSGKLGKTALFYPFSGNTSYDSSEAVLLVGCGKANEPLTAKTINNLAKTLYTSLSATFDRAEIRLASHWDNEQFSQLALSLLNQSYRFEAFKSKPAEPARLQQLVIGVSDEQQKAFEPLLQRQYAIHQGQTLTRDLANMPPNICTPSYLAEQAQALAAAYPELTVRVVDEAQMSELGMNCFLAVSRGSQQPAKLVLMEYQGASVSVTSATTDKSKKSKAQKSPLTNNPESSPIVLVGKGITFDTGGISLKPALNMGEMKFDMAGAATVLGVMKAVCQARLPINVVGALACAENMPSGQATRPGDIVTAMNGTTVEILNTDAEGRLVLCDTLSYVQRYQPQAIIDMATLTGAMVVALGNVRTGLFSNNEDLVFALERAGDAAHDRVWHMPLDDDYQEQLKSAVADVQNIGGMPAGSVTAACFLSKFVEDTPWVHLDIAGTAWQSGKEPAATGRPVPLLMQFLANQVDQS